MIILLLAWIYLTIVSFSWGKLLISFLGPGQKSLPSRVDFWILVCFGGVAILAAISQFLSLFIPLGSWYAQIIVIIPVLICLKNKSMALIISECYCKWKKVRSPVKILTVTTALLILIISSWIVSHPDSIGYHIQIIKWIGSYRILPGLANLNPRLGFQSAWFTLNALFTFPFIKAGVYTYLGSTVCIWYIVFIASLINRNINKGNFILAMFWAGLLAISFWSYTQIRLTASSPSPDFIAAIFILITIYLSFAQKDIPRDLSLCLQVIFSFTALSVKLSAIPICILGIYSLTKLLVQRKLSKNIALLMLILMIVCNGIVRNAITSGYIFYPSAFPDIVKADWKMPRYKAVHEAQYITAFAKTESEPQDKDIKETLDMHFYQWMPIWWSHRSIADKLIIVSLLALICSASLLIRRPIIKLYGLPLTITAIGLIFWFMFGPDPRFGWGFIIGFIGISTWMLYQKISLQLKPHTRGKAYRFFLNTVNAILISYTIYRFTYFFSAPQIIFPMGTAPQPFTSKACGDIQFNIAFPQHSCGDNNIPCIEGSCGDFLFRGTDVTDGFKSK
jgi:hypothetical protein